MRRSNKKIHTSSASGTRYAIGCMYNIFFHKTSFHIIFIFWQCIFNNFLEHIKLLIHHFTLPGENTLNDKYNIIIQHDDAIKWKHFPRNWLFVLGIHRSPVNSPHKGQWRGALIFFLIWVRINDSVNNHEAGDLRRYRAHHDVIVTNINIVSTAQQLDISVKQ